MYKKSLLLLVMSWAPILDLYAQSAFAGLDQLVGYCWQAPFADQKKYDTHCFEWVYGQSFIKDEHLVCGDLSNYAGMTVYSSDNNTIKYRYFNSLGGVSDGEVSFADQTLSFPDESYKKGEESQVFSTKWKLSEDSYVSEMAQIMVDKPARLVWKMTFKRIDVQKNPLIKRNNKGRLECL